jgi:hypothetical protein
MIGRLFDYAKTGNVTLEKAIVMRGQLGGDHRLPPFTDLRYADE